MRIRAALAPAIATASLLLLATVSAQAADDASLSDLLVEKGFITQEELDEARQAAGDAESEPAGETETKEEPGVDVSVSHKGLIVTSPDGDFKFGLGGRIQLDAGGFTGGITPQGDGFQLRRGRIKSFGTLYGDWDFKLEVNFDPDGLVFPTDAWLRYSGCDCMSITVGHQKVPFSQQSMTSSNWQVFEERALIDGMIDTGEEGRRRLGAVVASHGHNGVHWNATAGVFGEGLTDPGRPDEDWGTSGRLVVAPFAENRRLVAVGGSIYYRQFKSLSLLRYRSRPESSLGVHLVDTGIMTNAADTLAYNAEASFVLGRFHGQGEYMRVKVARHLASRLTFDGWYVQAGVFLTGENRVYDMKSAKYKRPKPKRKIGAWEIAARYSTLDLQDLDILGGREYNVTAGLNWWANQSVMIRFNYVRATLDPTTNQLIFRDGAGLDQSLNAFMTRFQVVF